MKLSTIFCADCGAANPLQAKFCFACGQTVSAPSKSNRASRLTGQLKPGELLRQRYKVLSQIGQGGFGAVYKAEDTGLGQRLLAVKEMSEQGLSSREIDEGVEAFKREALMLAGLMHENLPRIYDHFEEGGRWYLVMDYIEGETLEDRFSKARDGSLPLVMALKIALQLCDVLDYLHTRQPPIIFRDLKPANIIITPVGNLFLIDFGIARHFKPGQAKDTIAFGSPGYAAPEQYGKAQTTPRADIYSLGAILHQMLSGIDPSLAPFRFAPLHQCEPALQQLVALMLEMDEQRRPLSIAVVRQNLQYLRDSPMGSLSGAFPVLSSPLTLYAGQALPATSMIGRFPTLPGPPSPHLPVRVYEHHYGVVRAVAWSPDSTYVASATDAIIRVWHPQTGQNLSSYREHLGVLKHMAWSPRDMRIASVSQENKIRIWDATTSKTVGVYPGDPRSGLIQSEPQLLAWSPDGRYLAVAGSKYIVLWDTREHKATSRIGNKFFSNYRSLCWSPDGQHLAGAQGNNVLVHHLHARPKVSYYHYPAPVTAVAWSPDGTYLASGGYDQMIHVWNVESGELTGVYKSHTRPVSALAWSPDSRRIVSGSLATNINVWDARTGGAVIFYTIPVGHVLVLAWSPDGQFILSGGSDCKVYVWRAPQ
jgi:serine/threonine protein kinase/ribosomal protein L40E